jgi:hypothetical protein
MSPPQTMPGKYEYKNPLGEKLMKEFFIDLDIGIDINHLQIQFVRPLDQYTKDMDYHQFISSQYVMIKSKRYANLKKSKNQRYLIYSLQNLKNPIVDI